MFSPTNGAATRRQAVIFKSKVDTLFTAVRKTAAATDKKSSKNILILGNVLLKLDGDTLTITGTDTEIEVRATTSVEGIENGEITADAEKLSKILGGLPKDAEVSISLNPDEKVIVKSGRSRFQIATLPAEDYPALEKPSILLSFGIEATTLAKLLSKVSYAMAAQDVRYYLNGVFLELSGENLIAVATNGHRLAYAETTNFKNEIIERFGITIPRKAVLEMTKELKGMQGEIAVGVYESQIKIATREYSITTKLINGTFPEYMGVFPQNPQKTLIANKELLLKAINRAYVLSNKNNKGVLLRLSKDMLLLSAANQSQEEYEEELPVQYDDNEFEIGFNLGYLSDALGSCETDEVELHFNDEKSSVLLVGHGQEDNQKNVVMPMRF